MLEFCTRYKGSCWKSKRKTVLLVAGNTTVSYVNNQKFNSILNFNKVNYNSSGNHQNFTVCMKRHAVINWPSSQLPTVLWWRPSHTLSWSFLSKVHGDHRASSCRWQTAPDWRRHLASLETSRYHHQTYQVISSNSVTTPERNMGNGWYSSKNYNFGTSKRWGNSPY